MHHFVRILYGSDSFHPKRQQGGGESGTSRYVVIRHDTRLVTIHPWIDGNGRTTRLVMDMLQRQLGLIPSIVRKEDKVEYIQSLVDSREKDDSTIVQDMMLRHHIVNLNRRVLQYQENDGVKVHGNGVKHLNKTLQRIYHAIADKPEIKTAELMESLDISESTVTRSTRELKKLGFIKREGSDKTGRWIILK